ncbi:unnamed protein product [Lactuca saligna]|uniref:Leucine-rich repeat-containing N-terminal plant-type domain-containing protein n=1 Tax=Lactuca saligna TaxID=75948 RepID=A0AA35YB06_LACSI|nr:unnamed protein product [Lactuca saligna]
MEEKDSVIGGKDGIEEEDGVVLEASVHAFFHSFRLQREFQKRKEMNVMDLDDRSDAVAAFVSLARDNDWYGKLVIEEGGDNPLLKLVKEGKPKVTRLRAIRQSFIDQNRRLRNWRCGDPCVSNWTGVLCFSKTLDNGYLHIRELQLLNLKLSGTLSPEIRRLSYMQILLLNGNNLTGSLPEEIGNLPNLNRIQIDQNNISGPIPVSFSKLNNTKHLSFRNCNLQGSIPDLSRTPHLTYMLVFDHEREDLFGCHDAHIRCIEYSYATDLFRYAFKCHRKSEAGRDIVYPVNAIAFHPVCHPYPSISPSAALTLSLPCIIEQPLLFLLSAKTRVVSATSCQSGRLKERSSWMLLLSFLVKGCITILFSDPSVVHLRRRRSKRVSHVPTFFRLSMPP